MKFLVLTLIVLSLVFAACEATIRCWPSFRTPAHGWMRCRNGNFVWSVCYFGCDSGYQLSGARVSVCEGDGDKGQWSDPDQPRCG